jgi:RNA polymerase sigma-70 factor (ECF subfamily)
VRPPPPDPQPAAHPDQARWFAEEVQPHEGPLRAYLHRTFPSLQDIDDLVQESYLRILKARAITPIRSVAGFLFAIARRLAIDNFRRNREAGHETVTEFHSLRALREERGVVETVSLRQEAVFLAEAIDSLPARCREIVILRKLEGLSHHEIAARLGIAAETVQVQVGRGMRRMKTFMRERGLPGRAGPEGRRDCWR